MWAWLEKSYCIITTGTTTCFQVDGPISRRAYKRGKQGGGGGSYNWNATVCLHPKVPPVARVGGTPESKQIKDYCHILTDKV